MIDVDEHSIANRAAATRSIKPGPMKAASDALFLVTACLYTVIVLALGRVLELFGLPAYLLGRLGILRPAMRFPYWGLGLAGLAMIVACRQLVHTGWAVGDIGWFALWWLSLGAFMIFAFRISSPSEPLDVLIDRSGDHWPARWFRVHVRAPEDTFIVRGMIDVSLIIGFPLASMAICGKLTLFDAVSYLSALLITAARYEDLDHNDIHNNVFGFRPASGKLERFALAFVRAYARWFLNCACLRVPYRYKMQHLCIHHVENNGIDDIQTTIVFDRTSFFDFCKFALTIATDFAFGIDTFRYFAKRRRLRLFRPVFQGLCAWLVFLIVWEEIVPYSMIFFLFFQISAGVFAANSAYVWHAFADPDDPENVYRNTVNIVPKSAGRALNAALHLRHHLHAGEHWSKQVLISDEEREHCARQGALFLTPGEGDDRFRLLRALWMRRFDAIATWYFQIAPDGDDSMTDLPGLIESRTTSVRQPIHGAFYNWIDRRAGELAAKLLIGGKIEAP